MEIRPRKVDRVEKMVSKIPFLFFGFFILVFLIALLPGFFVVVQTGERGVLTQWGQIIGTPLTEGLHIKVPIMQQIHIINIKTVKIEAKASSASKDLQDVQTDIALNYKVNGLTAHDLFRTVGKDYAKVLVEPAIQEAIKSSTSKFNAAELITQRSKVRQDIETNLVEKLKTRGILVEGVNITNFTFSKEFTIAIEDKVKAQQDALKAKNDLVRIKIEKDQTITRAEATAEAVKKAADASAYAKVVGAEAEAKALKILEDQLKQSKEVLKLRTIEKWNGVMPKVISGDTIPLIDINIDK